MNKTDAIKDARTRLAQAQEKLTKMKTDNAARADALAAARTKADPIRKRAARRQIVFAATGGHTILNNGLPTQLGYVDPALNETLKTNRAKWIEAVANGQVSISVNATSMKPRGFAKRARYITPADLRRIRGLQQRQSRALQAYNEATKRVREAVVESFETGEPVTVAEVAGVIGSLAAIQAGIPKSYDGWYIGQAERDVEQWQHHLDALVKGTECNCWLHGQWEREAEQAAAAKRRAKMPRASFTCPGCGNSVVGYATDAKDGDGNPVPALVCPVDRCRKVSRREAVKHRKVAVSTPVGVAA